LNKTSSQEMKELHLASHVPESHIIYLPYCLQKRFASRNCLTQRLKFITTVCAVRSITITATVCGYKILLFPPYLIATVCGLLYACFQHPSPLSEISHTQEVLYLTYTADFYS
jgi:hypothetical protein